MPTIIALDVSLSMTRIAFHREGKEPVTFHDLAVLGINEFLDYLERCKSLEFVSLVVFSSLYEVIIDFTKNYSLIRAALGKLDHYDKTQIHNLLMACSNILTSNWGSQSYAQILMVTDCGTGLGPKSLKNLIISETAGLSPEASPIMSLPPQSKFSIICLGNPEDEGFKYGMNLYQQLLDVSKQRGQLFTTARYSENQSSMERSVVKLFKAMCEENYKPFEAYLKIGSYTKLDAVPIALFPEPLPFTTKDAFGNEKTRFVSKNFEICGYIKIADLVGFGGSPESFSRNVVFPRVESSHKKVGTELDKLESEMKQFFAKSAAADDEESSSSMPNPDVTTKESAVVLLHGALKVENCAALVLLADDWYGLLYSYSDKKKSNLMLSILQPSSVANPVVIPWIGDFRFLGLLQDSLPEGSLGYPVRTEKKSYSSGNMSWLKESALQSDFTKLLRHSKKMPEKTSQFYKELNRIRRNAQSLGFEALIEALADVFEKEALALMAPNTTANPECAIQLNHAARELRRGDRDLIKKFEV